MRHDHLRVSRDFCNEGHSVHRCRSKLANAVTGNSGVNNVLKHLFWRLAMLPDQAIYKLLSATVTEAAFIARLRGKFRVLPV